MSYLFRGKKRYFDFIESLEKEEQEFHRINQEYAAKSEMCNIDYKIKAQHVTQTLRRLGAREIRHVDPLKHTAKSRASTSINKSRTNKYKNSTQQKNNAAAAGMNNGSFLNTSPARLVSNQWPVRPSSAYRILTPVTKMKKYNDMDEDVYKKTKDPPLIHSTGISNISFSKVSNSNSGNIFTNTQSPKTNECDSSSILNDAADDDNQ